MDKNSVITLDQEIVRLCKNHFNNAEPPAIVTVTKVYSNSADVKYSFVDPETGETQNIIDRDVPILKPAYGNINVGDEVLLAFIGGNENNPIILGAKASNILGNNETGRGIVSVDKVETNGLTDVYRITYDREPIYSYFLVKNGIIGEQGPKGDQGPPGEQGSPGPQGLSGVPSELSGKTVRLPVLIEEKTVTNQSSVTFDGLNGDEDGEYFILSDLSIKAYGADRQIELRPNNVSGTFTSTIYNNDDSGSIGGAPANLLTIGSAIFAQDTYFVSKANFYVKSGKVRTLLVDIDLFSTFHHSNQRRGGYWSNITDNITSIVITVTTGGSFSGIIKLYKMVDVTYPTN